MTCVTDYMYCTPYNGNAGIAEPEPPADEVYGKPPLYEGKHGASILLNSLCVRNHSVQGNCYTTSRPFSELILHHVRYVETLAINYGKGDSSSSCLVLNPDSPITSSALAALVREYWSTFLAGPTGHTLVLLANCSITEHLEQTTTGSL